MPTLAVVWSRCSSIYVLNEGTVMKGGFKYEVQHVLKTGETLHTEF